MIIEYEGKRPIIGRDVFIAPTAVIIGDVVVADGASIWFGAVIRGDLAPIHIGKKTNVQDNCTLHVDSNVPLTIGSGVTIGHNAVIHGCTVEDGCLIGINAVVLNRACIKSGSVVAAGAVVKEGQIVGPGHLVTGIPAEFKRDLSPLPSDRIENSVSDYVALSRHYREPIGKKNMV